MVSELLIRKYEAISCGEHDCTCHLSWHEVIKYLYTCHAEAVQN